MLGQVTSDPHYDLLLISIAFFGLAVRWRLITSLFRVYSFGSSLSDGVFGRVACEQSPS